MAKDKDKTRGPASRNIEEILQERERLDQILQQEFRKEITIVFTDICGYTEYIDTRGDISGRAFLLKHNRIVLPLIEKHEGKVIEMIGDAVMASFASALAAVKASMAIQKALAEHNQKADAGDNIRVKIGVNSGQALVDEDASYQGYTGDVANVAARIQSKAGPEQILVSKAVYDQVCGSEDLFLRFHKTIQAKGKAAPLEVYRVVWQGEDLVQYAEPALRIHEAHTDSRGQTPLRVFQLEITREGHRLKISAYEQLPGEESTIRHYEEMSASFDMIREKCRQVADTLNKSNRQGRVGRQAVAKLREIGQVLHDELFSLTVKEKLEKTQARYLCLNIDDQLVQVPWELLNDGQLFLCQRFNMGRVVKTRQPMFGITSRNLARPLKMLVLADPEGDLKGAYDEGTQIRDHMDGQSDLVNAFLRTGNITPDFIKAKMRNFDLVHFAGHADYNPKNPGNSGWRLTGGNFKAQDITRMAGTATMPALIFSNACQSARTDEWTLTSYFEDQIFGLANSFLLAGVKHYVGTFWEVSDEASKYFALEFYKHLFAGMTIGEAIRRSRSALVTEHGEETIVWASYVLYGDPTFNYSNQLQVSQALEEPATDSVSARAEVKTREEVIDFGKKEVPKRHWVRWGAAGICLLVAVLLWGYPGILRQRTVKYEQAALSYYEKGDFQAALDACRILDEKNHDIRLTHLIRGNIYLANGQLDAAQTAYKKAVQSPLGPQGLMAQALLGLGRIASLKKQPDTALKYYKQATDLSPDARAGYLSQALLLEEGRDYDKALALLARAQAVGPQDRVLMAITKEIQDKVTLSTDAKRQDRLDRAVKALLETMRTQTPTSSWDGWTSPPLTLWIMGFKTQGYAFQEGQERLLVSGMTNQFLQHGRARLVERALLDKLVKELNLGTTKLIDRRTALSLGKIMAARLIVSGQMVYSGSLVQVSVRVIETETGQISAAVNESFGRNMDTAVMADTLSKALLEKLDQLYLLRGKISEVEDKQVHLNIGKMAGVKIGQRFKTIDADVTLEITSLEQDSSVARIVSGEGEPLQKGFRVEIL